ncbi:MAG: substrate-binding domain-containing protein [Planctomycetaceae bacterium]
MRSILIVLWLATIGCGGSNDAPRTITLATTTSTRDSGLLDVLVPMFEQETGIVVKVVAVGSGQALAMGRRGDVDVLLTHAPEAEERFVAEGHGIERRPVMHNDFVLVGPRSDPARVRETRSTTEAFARIADSRSPFVSRGDESGTHSKERSIWGETGIVPEGDWSIEAGSGMAQTLRLASEKEAYTLADRGTFLAQRERLDLEITLQGDPALRNRYAVIVVNPRQRPHVDIEAARRFADFLLAPDTQSTIGRFGVERFGEPLFFPHDAEEDEQS